jgi:beta-lactamase regulating signal transducer with metallopeptidase domain
MGCVAWRRAAAATRHWIWFLAVAGIFALPVISGLRTAGDTPLWKPVWTMGSEATSENILTFTLSFTPNQTGIRPANQAALASTAVAVAGSTVGQAAGNERWVAHLPAVGVAAALVLWLGGAGLLLVNIALGTLRLRALRLSARPPAAEWQSLLEQLREELGIGRRVVLLQSGEDVMPATWGWWRPVVLLPAEADEWSPERRRLVLLHELAHVKRWDCLTQLAARLACAVYWFNPLVWVAARRMCVEREGACDDLVLNGGCQPSDYAGHLLEIARSFRRMPAVAAITMARSSQLEGRIAAIVDAARVRRGPRGWLIALAGLVVLAFTAMVAVPNSQAQATVSSPDEKPWWDARLRAFFVEKAAQAHELAGQSQVPAEVWPFFAAGTNGDWQTATNLWTVMRQRAHQYEGTTADTNLDKVWAPILELDLAWQQFAGWKEKYVLAYGNDIIKSIPPGSIYFGGTDPGRGVITVLSESQVEGKPFYTLTQNALADATYLEYLRAMYGRDIHIATAQESQQAFEDYTTDAVKRKAENKLRPGEVVIAKDGGDQVSGQVAVMNINGLIAKTIFDHNPKREFYVEESFPLDWMYPYLTPNGLIMKINREPLAEIPESILKQDHDYWANYLQPMLGDGVTDDSTVAAVTAWAEKVYLNHDLSGFTGDPGFVQDLWAQKAFSKLRTSIGGVYAWRSTNAKTPAEKQRMAKAAEQALLQAYALCPTSPEALFRYVNLLLTVNFNRLDDALLVAETSLKLDPENQQTKDLIVELNRYKASRGK